MQKITLTVLFCLALSVWVHGETIALWNFNDAASGATGGANEFLVDRGSGTMSSDFALATIGNAAGSTVNSQDGDPAGQALSLKSSANNGKSLFWYVSTAGFESIGVSFATQRTSTGFSRNQFQYSLDSGASWLSFGDLFSPATSFALQIFDLSGIADLNNNAAAAFRIIFDGATSATGNNRIDNLIVSGTPIVPPITTPVPEPVPIALMGAGLAGILIIRPK